LVRILTDPCVLAAALATLPLLGMRGCRGRIYIIHMEPRPRSLRDRDRLDTAAMCVRPRTNMRRLAVGEEMAPVVGAGVEAAVGLRLCSR